MKKVFFALVALAAGFSAYGYYSFRTVEFTPEISTVTVTGGDVVDTVGATGALEAVTTVQVGSQVSGIIQELQADYNSIVRAGRIIARLDPSLFETQIEQARANLVRAEADLERLCVAVDDTAHKLTRAEDLADRNLISAIELEAAQVELRLAQAQLKSAGAQVAQAQAALNQNEVNLEHTVIRAPIDGIVISRLVDVGQTVAASLQAPELFVIAADLTKMRVIASIDESDVGRIRPDQAVTFTVDAFPAEEFSGTVSQVRLEPVVQQNVVTYATVINAPNPDLKLKPGMTATVTLEIARRDNVLRIPNAALRFRPTSEMFAALKQPVPESIRPVDRSPVRATPTERAGVPSMQPGGNAAIGIRDDPGQPTDEFANSGRSRGFGSPRGVSPDPDRRRQMRERLAQMSPEERERFLTERRTRRSAGGSGRPGGNQPEERRLAATPERPTVPAVERGASSIDALFGPLPPTVSTGHVWILEDGWLTPVSVRLGVTDGTATELLGTLGAQPSRGNPQIEALWRQLDTVEDQSAHTFLEQALTQVEAETRSERLPGPASSLLAGTQLVTNITTPAARSNAPSGGSGSPLVPQFRRRARR